MLETFMEIIKNIKQKIKPNKEDQSKNLAKQRLRIVLLQDRTNVSADFISLMKQEIIEVIKKYVLVDESTIDVNMTNALSKDGKTTESGLSVKIPIIDIKSEMVKTARTKEDDEKEKKLEEKKEEALNNSSNYLITSEETENKEENTAKKKTKKSTKSSKSSKLLKQEENTKTQDVVVTDITQVLDKLPQTNENKDMTTETIVISTQEVVDKLMSEEKNNKKNMGNENNDLNTTSEIEILIGDSENI